MHLLARLAVALDLPKPLRAGQAAFWRPLAVLGLAALAACGGPQVRSKPRPQPPPQFANVRYPAPRPLPEEPAQLPPAPMEDDDLFPHSDPIATVRRDRVEMARAMRNAALRDEAHADLLHGYFALVETLYRVMPARGSAPDNYDPVPLMRFHGEISSDLDTQRLRAEVLAERWSELAAEQGVDLNGSVDEPSVAGRLRLLTKFSRCARDDLDARWQHGQRWVVAKADRRSDAELRADPPAPQQFASDMLLLRKTLDCSRYLARVMRSR